MLCIHETYLVYKLQTFKNCTEVKNIKIMIIAIIYIIFLSDISSTVENYFQKILSCPPEKSTPPFLLTLPLKIQNVQVPLFGNIEKLYASPPCRKRERTLWLLLRNSLERIQWVLEIIQSLKLMVELDQI